MPKKIIIDCDPGQDDAIALLLAMASPEELELLGITAVAGNVPLHLTERNARLMCDLGRRGDVPVFAGCSRPMVRDLVTAEKVHGDTGIDGMDVTDPVRSLQQQHAVDFIIDTLKNAEEASITLVPTGPLTNIGMAMAKDPSILRGIKQIVLMGGAMREGGNFSPSAEFNILVDPHAAKVVFACGRPITAMGLDVTHQVIATKDRVARIEALGNPAATATVGMLNFFNRHDSAKYGFDGAPLHDPCTVAWLLQPGLFEGKDCNIEIETESPLTIGHTAIDFWGISGREVNATWIHSVDADGFYDLLTDRLARFGDT